MEKIDNLDKKILRILSKNARIPFKDVAAECNVSRAAIHQRVQHLIEGNVIMGSGFDVNPKSLGYSTCTYVGITLERGSMYKDVVERLQHIPEIVECHFTTGPYTMLVKLYARDNEQLMHLLNGQLQDIPGVVATETLPVHTTLLKMPGKDPCTCLYIQANITEQFIFTSDNSHSFQSGNMCGINLHQAIICADNFSAGISVMIDGPGIQAAFFTGNYFQ